MALTQRRSRTSATTAAAMGSAATGRNRRRGDHDDNREGRRNEQPLRPKEDAGGRAQREKSAVQHVSPPGPHPRGHNEPDASNGCTSRVRPCDVAVDQRRSARREPERERRDGAVDQRRESPRRCGRDHHRDEREHVESPRLSCHVNRCRERHDPQRVMHVGIPATVLCSWCEHHREAFAVGIQILQRVVVMPLPVVAGLHLKRVGALVGGEGRARCREGKNHNKTDRKQSPMQPQPRRHHSPLPDGGPESAE